GCVPPPAIVGDNKNVIRLVAGIPGDVICINAFVANHWRRAGAGRVFEYATLLLCAKAAHCSAHINGQRFQRFQKGREGHALHSGNQPGFMIHLYTALVYINGAVEDVVFFTAALILPGSSGALFFVLVKHMRITAGNDLQLWEFSEKTISE